MPDPATTGAATACTRDAVRDAAGEGAGNTPAHGENVRGPCTEQQHRILRRARRVSTLMLELWGDAPPPAPDPALTAAMDALAADDGTGRAAHLIVQGDHFTYQQLSRVLALIEDPDHLTQVMTILPPRLRRRLLDDELLPACCDPE